MEDIKRAIIAHLELLDSAELKLIYLIIRRLARK